MRTRIGMGAIIVMSLLSAVPTGAAASDPPTPETIRIKGRVEVTGAQGARITAATITAQNGQTNHLEMDVAGEDLARVMFGQWASVVGLVSERGGQKWLRVTGFTDDKYTAAHELWRRSRCNACAVQNGALHSAEPQDLHGAAAVVGRPYPGKQFFRSITRDSKYLCLATDDLIYQVDLAVRTLVKTYDRTAGWDDQPLTENYFQELLPYTVDDPSGRSVLIIGLAGGMTASILKQYAMQVEAVDLDPAVIALARKYFSFDGPAVVADGRWFLRTCTNKYDFCVMDTYSGDVFPFHLCSVEAFRAARGVLKPGAILALNFIGSPRGLPFACIHRTLRGVFAHVLAIRGEEGDDVQTITLFASDTPIEFNNGWTRYLGVYRGVDPVTDAIRRSTVEPARPDGLLLTDNYNPIDFLRAEEALRWRQRTVSLIGRPN